MKRTTYFTSILLLVAIFVVVAAISERFFFRLDLTEGGQYSLSNATKDILRNLDSPVTVKAYFTKDLAPDLEKVKDNFQDMLIEYNNISGGKVVYEFNNPNEKAETENEAIQVGIQPVLLNIREKDEIKQQKVYLGAVISLGNAKEVIPFVDPNGSIEYNLSTAIKKLSLTNKPEIGFVQGQGEPPINAFSQVLEELGVLYHVKPVYLSDTVRNLNDFRVLVIAAPQDTFDLKKLDILDNYLSAGGKLFVALNHVEGNLQTMQGTVKRTGFSEWLKGKGLRLGNQFVIDANCGTVGLSQRTNFGTMTTQVRFPFMPSITNFTEHPVTKGLEQIIIPFCSPITYTGDSSKYFTPIAYSSDQSGVLPVPVFFDVNKKWTNADFNAGKKAIAGFLEGNINGNRNAKIAIISNGDFAVNGTGQRPRRHPQDNISLMANGIDWLADDTGLIELRTKTITSRPIEQMSDGKRTTLKWINFLLPLVLVILYGLVRIQIKRNQRIKRMQEGYVK